MDISKSELIETLAGFSGRLTGVCTQLCSNMSNPVKIGLELAYLDTQFCRFVLDLEKEDDSCKSN